MIVSTEKIADMLEQGRLDRSEDPLVITPCPEIKELKNQGAAAVDLRLGTWFLTLRRARLTHLQVSENSAEALLTKTHYVPFGGKYLLHPQCFVLGVTLEWIRLPCNIGGYVVGKSSLGRRGLIIATATGVHPGFTGCLTLELTNVGEIPVSIQPGMLICQLFLHDIDGAKSKNVDKSTLVGWRRPKLGKYDPDKVAKKLADAYKVECLVS
jgi:dCTP deaminase